MGSSDCCVVRIGSILQLCLTRCCYRIMSQTVTCQDSGITAAPSAIVAEVQLASSAPECSPRIDKSHRQGQQSTVRQLAEYNIMYETVATMQQTMDRRNLREYTPGAVAQGVLLTLLNKLAPDLQCHIAICGMHIVPCVLCTTHQRLQTPRRDLRYIAVCLIPAVTGTVQHGMLC